MLNTMKEIQARFEKRRWCLTRHIIDEMKAGGQRLFKLTEINNVKTSIQRTKFAYGDRQYRCLTKGLGVAYVIRVS